MPWKFRTTNLKWEKMCGNIYLNSWREKMESISMEHQTEGVLWSSHEKPITNKTKAFSIGTGRRCSRVWLFAFRQSSHDSTLVPYSETRLLWRGGGQSNHDSTLYPYSESLCSISSQRLAGSLHHLEPSASGPVSRVDKCSKPGAVFMCTSHILTPLIIQVFRPSWHQHQLFYGQLYTHAGIWLMRGKNLSIREACTESAHQRHPNAS